MVIDVRKYSHHFTPVVERYFRHNDTSIKNQLEMAGRWAAGTGVPIIAVYIIIMNVCGETPEMNEKLDELKKFYNITKILR